MAIIKESLSAEEIKSETQEAPGPSAGTFEEVEKTKARLFHSRHEALRLLGIRNHLLIFAGLIIGFLACACFPFITTVEDAQALVIPAQLVHVEALKEGKLTDVFVQEGETVQKGQVIARIVNREDEREIEAAKGELELCQARLEVLDAKRIYSFERYGEDKRLLEQKVISRDEFVSTELSFKTLEREREVLEAELSASKAKLDRLEEEKREGTMSAPVSGQVISDVQEKLGAYVMRGAFLLTLASPEQRLEFFLAEEDHGRVDVGDPARVKFYFLPTKTFRGRVVRLKHYAEPVEKHGEKKNFIKALIDVEDFPQGIRNGMTAKVRIKGKPVSLLNGIRRRI